ncbi:FimB/Mfa2 family fimbrial subunit [Segatella copri]|uniref:FimB/Mfa2 family fimbrial subunit n=1 Tax=Segatella copri TaxID=165179 RepID=UPI002FF27A08
MKMKTIFMALTAMMLLTACYHDKHEFTPNEYDGKPVGYVTPQLLWEDEADAAAIGSINALSFQVQGANGVSRARSFSSIEESADWLQQLPAGEYDILVTADMDEPSGYILTATGAPSENMLVPTSVSLKAPASSPRQSWYAVTHVTIREEEITVAEFKLQRLLPTLTINVTGVPAGTTVAIAVEQVAESVLLTEKDANGRYGVIQSAETKADFGLLTPAADDATTLCLDGKRLMPTAASQSRSLLRITTTEADGTVLTSTADCPRMELGHYYTLDFQYAVLSPYMRFEAMTINDWQDGWTISGEILNPTNK